MEKEETKDEKIHGIIDLNLGQVIAALSSENKEIQSGLLVIEKDESVNHNLKKKLKARKFKALLNRVFNKEMTT
jgi:hypothetical protein